MSHKSGIGLGLAATSHGLRVTEWKLPDSVHCEQIVMNGAVDKCGTVHKGDVITQIDGKAVKTVAHAQELILGDEGTGVKISISRPGVGE
eukprot:1444335-Rhodomonas_salina.1